MPGLLTPERRQRAKHRARSSHANKKTTLGSKINKDKKSSSSYHALSVDTDDPQSSNFNANSSIDSNIVILRQPTTITPTASSDSPPRSSSRWNDFDESTAGSTLPYSSSESIGSPARQSNTSPKYSIKEDSMYASEEEMPMDEMMGTRKKSQKKTSPSPSPSPASTTKALHKQKQNKNKKHSVATYRSVTPTKEVGNVLGLSNIMAMVSPSNWNTTDFFNQDGSDKSIYMDPNTSETNNGMSGGKRVSSPPNSTTGIQRIIAVLNSGSPSRLPPNLNREEHILWDSLQTAMITDRTKQLSEKRAEKEVTKAKTIRADMQQKYNAMSIVVENQHQSRKSKNEGDHQDNGGGDSNSSKRDLFNLQLQEIDLLKQELQAKDTLMKEKEDNHTTEVLAIQRVLADVTTEKFQLEEIMETQQQSQEGNGIGKTRAIGTKDAVALASVSNKELNKLKNNLESSREETEAATREAERKSEQIKALKSDLNDALLKMSDTIEENKKLQAESKATADEVVDLKSKLESLQSKLESLQSNSGKGDFEATIEELKAEVSYQKLETEKLKVEKMESQVAHASASDEVNRLKTENELARQEMDKLKRERDQVGTEADKLKEENKLAQQDLEKLKMEQQYATNELDELRKAREHLLDKAINEAKASSTKIENNGENGEDAKEKNEEAKSGVSSEEFEKLQQTLSVTASSLETSKKIIASLENANGSLAIDSRSKLKEREEELSVVQKESEERKRNLDSLATELRDLQRKQGDIENADRRTKVQLIRQKALMDHLDSTLTDLQAAVVIHESSVTMMESSISNSSNIEEIAEILGDALHAITATLETSEQFVDEVDDSSVGNTDVEYGEVSSEVGRRIDAIIRNDREAASRGLSHELDQKTVAVKRLEEALKKQNEEMRRVRSQFYNSDNNQLRTEIQRLRQQCTTNMEVLARKERELSVLRSSLKVDDNESGYISDDASDDEDEDGGTDVRSILSVAKLNGYGPADAEAYATILSQGNGRIEMTGSAQIQEIEALKRDLMEALGEKESASKELQARRESLANAKMIISSLEIANKGMMEDLRSRLQDSNTAISSLLDKSKESEKAADDLREKLQRLEQEKLEERDNYEAELEKSRKELENRNEVSPEEKKEEVI
jgi:hypothetical protein